MRTPHSSTNRGKRVQVITRDGRRHLGRFHEKKGGAIVILDESGFIQVFPMKKVRVMSIYKPHTQ